MTKNDAPDDRLRTGGALDGPIGREIVEELAVGDPSLEGRTLAHYTITGKIGHGGMGTVFVADDAKLGREVALKVLPRELASDEGRRQRFEREARAVAALNHPNIVTVYSVEVAAGVHFFTMELVSGKTLRRLVPKNGFPLAQFFEIAIPLTDAVATAHQSGITHRDLKPDNVMVNDEGRVKVLDFGLAKPTPEALPQKAEAEEGMTRDGVIAGTPGYMSPEQAQGEVVDARSDIFSLGIVLYEMLTGSRPERADTPAQVSTSIITDERSVRSGVPRELLRLLRRCLAVKKSSRVQNALDVRNELEQLQSELQSGVLGDTAPVRAHRAPLSRLYPWLVAVLAVSALGIVWLSRSRDPAPRLVNPTQVTLAGGAEDFPSWSPDGSRLVYESNQNGDWDIWISQVGGGGAVNLTADHGGDNRYPSWSPDGRDIAFLSRRDDEWNLYTMPALGGSVHRLSSSPLTMRLVPMGAPQWSSDATEIAVPVFDPPSSYAEIFDTRSGATRRVLLPRPDGDACWSVTWSPDGRWFAYIGAIDWTANITRVWIVSAGGGEPIAVTDGQWNDWSPSWSSDGRALYYISNRGGAMDLWRQRITENGTPEGDASAVTSGLGIRSAVFSPSGDKLAYSRGPRLSANAWRVPILDDRVATWADAEQLTFERALVEFIDVSRDGERLAMSSDRSGNSDLWVLSLEDRTSVRLTNHPAPDWGPMWNPEGTELAFYSHRSGNRDIWIQSASGGPARQITFDPTDDNVPAWSPDGSEIVFASWRSGSQDLWVVSPTGGEPRRLTFHEQRDTMPKWSHDGRWVIFPSARTGTNRVWRIPAEGGEAELLSMENGLTLRPSLDGETVYYHGPARPPGTIFALSLDDGSERAAAELTGRHGRLGFGLSVDESYIYFNWWEDVGDIWVMDVVH